MDPGPAPTRVRERRGLARIAGQGVTYGVMDRFLDPAILGVMIPIVAIVGVFTLVILKAWARHQERMAMIAQGMHPDGPGLADPEDDPELIDR